MSAEQIDATMHRLRSAIDSARANLLAVELDQNRELLDSAPLQGESAARWGEASATLVELWHDNELLDQLLQRAERVRGARARPKPQDLAELEQLLGGKSVELAGARVPLDQRQLLGANGSLWLTPDELLVRSAEAFERPKGVLVAAQRAWTELAQRLRELLDLADEDAALASELAEGEPPSLEPARKRLLTLIELLPNDPLAVNEEEIAQLGGELRSIRADLGDLDAMRVELTPRLSAARGLLAELARLAQQGRDAHEQVLAKVADPHVPEPLPAQPTLEGGLEDVESISRAGAWREARTLLEQWTGTVSGLLARAREILSANRAPIRERDELRGLLDACQAKARRLRLVENAELAGMFRRAQDALYTAPTDLAQASQLVHGYRAALGEHARQRELTP
jgi:hypothetical protein